MSPWQILGIPYGSSRRVVKQAYARLLKEHRPDRDPAGFRRIRDAYEQLRDVPEQAEPDAWEQEAAAPREAATEPAPQSGEPAADRFEDDTAEVDAEARWSDDEAEPADPGEDPRVELEEEDQPPPWWLVRPPFLMRLRRALHRTSAGSDPQRELRVLRVAVQRWRQGQREAIPLESFLLTALRQKPLVQTLLTPTDVTNELDRGAWTVTRGLLEAYLASGDMNSVNAVVAAIEAWCARRPQGNCAPFLVEAAGYLAFLDRAAAERLLDAAFRLRSGGDLHTGDVDLRIAVGREIRAATFAERLNFTRALLLPPERRNDADESIAATSMRQRYGCAPLLGVLFKARLPKRWDFVISAPIEVRPPQPSARPHPSRPHEPLRTEPEARRLSRSESIAWILVLMVLAGIAGAVARNRDKPPAQDLNLRPPPTNPDQERIRRLLWPTPGSPPLPPVQPGNPTGGR